MKFEEIWEENHLHLKYFIATKVPNQDIMDILQNVSIEFFKNVQNHKEIQSPKKWLFQVTRNLIADYYKTKNQSNESELNFANTSSEGFQHCVCSNK